MDQITEQTQQTVTKKTTTPSHRRSALEKQLRHVPWQRMALSLVGIAMIAGMWRWAVFHLYSIPEHTVVAFASVTNNAFYVIAAIVVFMVTGKLVYDWKNTTATTLVDEASHLTERRKEDKTEDIHEVIEHVIDEKVPNTNLREFQEY